MPDKKLYIHPVTYSEGVTLICDKCKRVLATGRTILDVTITGDNNVYSIRSKEKYSCCGTEKLTPELFDSDQDAINAITSILERFHQGKLPELVMSDKSQNDLNRSYQPPDHSGN